jgi:opacity protein-like surface antigen
MMVVLASGAYAADVNPYASAKLNLGSAKMVSEMGPLTAKGDSAMIYGGSVAAGASVGLNDMFAVRVEAEAGLNYSKMGSGMGFDANVMNPTIGGNVYLDWKATKEITPYVGAGLAYGFVGTKMADVDDSYDWSNQGGMNYNFGLGVAYAMNKNLSVDLGARYVNQIVDEEDLGFVTTKVYMESYVVSLGARYAF